MSNGVKKQFKELLRRKLQIKVVNFMYVKNVNVMYLYGINIYFTNELKDETLHHEGKILKFSKICHFFFPTYEEKSTDFKK